MKKYIGVGIVEAEKDIMPEGTGYRVFFPDGHVSWVLEDAFNESFLRIIPSEAHPSHLSVSQEMVDDFIEELHTSTIGEKNTLVRCVLKNGFEIVEASACVDPDNYSEEIGAQICLGKIKDKIWSYLGFLLQTATGSVR